MRIGAISARDPAAFERIYYEHSPGVFWVACRVLGDATQAQDVVQDVFMRVWRRPGAFDARRGEIATYLRLMARSRALDVWREGQAAGRASDRLKVVVEAEPAAVADSPAAVAETDATRETVFEALKTLPESQRDALVLAYWGGLTAGQIADREQVPLGTAKSRLRLGLARLRQECPALALEAA